MCTFCVKCFYFQLRIKDWFRISIRKTRKVLRQDLAIAVRKIYLHGFLNIISCRHKLLLLMFMLMLCCYLAQMLEQFSNSRPSHQVVELGPSA